MIDLAFRVMLGGGLLLLMLGTISFMLSAQLWRNVTKRGSRWANQASTSGFIFFAGIGSVGAVIFAMYAGEISQGWNSSQWPEVEARIETSRIVEVRQPRATTMSYRIDATFSYQIGEVRYRSSQIDFGGMTTTDRAWLEEKIAGEFAPGASIVASYNPTEPGRAVINAGIGPRAWIFSGLGAAFLVISVWQLRGLLRNWEGEPIDKDTRSRKERKRSEHARIASGANKRK